MFDKNKRYWCLVEKREQVKFTPGLYFAYSNTDPKREWQLCDVTVTIDNEDDTNIIFKPMDPDYAPRVYSVKSLAAALEEGSVIESTATNGPVFVRRIVPITPTVNRVDTGYVISDMTTVKETL